MNWAAIGGAVIQSSIKTRWLLASCGVLYAAFSLLIYMLGPDGSTTLRTYLRSKNVIVEMGVLALAAGACTIAAGIWNSRKENSWLLVLNGMCCGALGLLLNLGATRPVAFRTLALFIVPMAVSIGLYEFVTARTLHGRLTDEWLLGAAGVFSVGFALVFLGFALRWLRLEPSPSAQTFHWLASYFGFTAICMLGLSLRFLNPRPATPRLPWTGSST
jgi:uncharacterized membrane protein HdeD (DUF308 family)